ncbi:MAG: tetratricopeptide repeat protein [Thermodesulfobacteriota bacterium]
MSNKPFPVSRSPRGEARPVPGMDASVRLTGFSFRDVRVIAVGCLALVTALVYLPALRQEVVELDYSSWVRAVQPLGLKTLIEVFAYDGARWKELGYFAPLTATSFMVDFYVGSVTGHQEAVHKLVNLLLHLVNTGLVLWLLRLLGFSDWVALAVAAIFALHPLQVSSLEWIPERKNLLMSSFFLSGLVLYCQYRNPVARKRRFSYYAGSFGCFVGALLCKPAAVVFGPCLILTDALLLARGSTGRSLLRSAPFLILGLVWGAVAMKTELGISEAPPLLDRLMLAPYQQAFLMVKFFVPAGLTLLYPHPDADLFSWWWWVPALGFVLCAALMVRSAYSGVGRAAVWGLGFYTVNLVPASGIVPFSGMKELWVADHYQYLAIIGLGVAAVVAAERVTDRLSGRPRATVRGLAFATAMLLMCAFSHNQVWIWNGPESLWTHVVRINPGSAMGHLNYGSLLYEKGRFLDAEREFRKALSLNERYVEAYKVAHTLGLLSERRGALDQAVQDLRKALELNPRHGESHLELSRLLFNRGAFAESLAHCLQAEQCGTPCNRQGLEKLIAAESLRIMREYVRQ